jgi:hypothetical protein
VWIAIQCSSPPPRAKWVASVTILGNWRESFVCFSLVHVYIH